MFKKSRVKGICSIYQFQKALTRERLRSERSGRRYSLIAFEVAGAKPSLINSFAEALRKRIRCYDEIGFIEENRLAVLLPETPLEEAHKLAESLCHTVLPRQRDVRYELYSYPLPCKQDQNNTMEAGCLKPPRDTDRESAQYLLQE